MGSSWCTFRVAVLNYWIVWRATTRGNNNLKQESGIIHQMSEQERLLFQQLTRETENNLLERTAASRKDHTPFCSRVSILATVKICDYSTGHGLCGTCCPSRMILQMNYKQMIRTFRQRTSWFTSWARLEPPAKENTKTRLPATREPERTPRLSPRSPPVGTSRRPSEAATASTLSGRLQSGSPKGRTSGESICSKLGCCNDPPAKSVELFWGLVENHSSQGKWPTPANSGKGTAGLAGAGFANCSPDSKGWAPSGRGKNAPKSATCWGSRGSLGH